MSVRYVLIIFVCFGLSELYSNGLKIDIKPCKGIIFNKKEVNASNLHSFLDEHEITLLFGENYKDSNFQIVNVKQIKRFKRSSPLTKNKLINLIINRDNHIKILLEKSPKLIDDSFVFIRRYENSSEMIENSSILDKNLKNCFYRSDNSAFDVCDGKIKGIFRNNSTDFVIHPLPKRFGENYHIVLETKPITIYDELKSRTTNFTADDFFHVNESMSEHYLARKRRYIGTNTNEIANDLHIETAIFIDRDLYRHMETNYPYNTETNLIRFVLAMVNGVQLLYHHPSLGHKINFVLKRLEILYSDPKDLRRSSDIDIFLNSFCSWQKNLNPTSDENSVHYDHAVILTGLDLYVVGKNGKVSSQVVGLAPVAGMCTATSSCTINEGKHFESVYVVAHEIGHNLGMRHDTSENNCDPSLYIMSPTLGSGKITWSQCSRDYLNNFLRTPQSKCLMDRGQFGANLDHSAEGLLPGERFDADQQCMLKYGKDSLKSRTQNLNDICRDLHCQRDRYTWTSHPALEGTNCGDAMWCKSGVCTLKATFLESYSIPKQIPASKIPDRSNFIDDHKYASLKQEAIQKKTISIWSDWGQPSECESGCLYGESGRLREGSTGLKIYSRSCIDYRYRRKCHGLDKKYEACTSKQCYDIPRTTVLEFANQICQRAKEFDSEIVGNGIQKVGVTSEESCKVFCETRSGQPSSRYWTFPDGTSCRNQDSDIDDNFYCVAGRCEKFTCTNSSVNLYKMNPAFCPHNFIYEEKITENIQPTVAQENGRDYKRMDIKRNDNFRDDSNNRTKNEVFDNDYGNRKYDLGVQGYTKANIYHEWRSDILRKDRNRTKNSRDLSEWTIKTKCHFNCIEGSKGIQVLANRYDLASNIQLCPADAVECNIIQTTTDFATNLCQRFQQKVRGLSGNGMQISPSVQEPDRSCRVACQDYYIHHRFYLVNGDQGHFPFGTRCSKLENRFCVNGKCLEFGIDDLPVKESHFTLALYRTKRNIENTMNMNLNSTRMKRNFINYTPTNIVEKIDNTFLEKLAADVNDIFQGKKNMKENGLDLNNPIYISTEDFHYN